MSTKLMQVVVPITQVPVELMADALKAREHRWEPVYETGWDGPVGFHAPKYGAVIRCAYVMAEVDEETHEIVRITKFQFDQMVRKDGPINDYRGHATVNAMAVVVEERPDGFYVWGVREWRPVMYNHRTDTQGVEVVGITGGWAKKVGANPIETALEELVAEAGYEIDEATVESVNIHSPNRAYEEACNEVILARFKAKGKRRPDESHEVVGDQIAYRLDEFPLGPDALVNSALWAVAKYLHCISPKRVSG